jgi:hypothetical protein
VSECGAGGAGHLPVGGGLVARGDVGGREQELGDVGQLKGQALRGLTPARPSPSPGPSGCRAGGAGVLPVPAFPAAGASRYGTHVMSPPGRNEKSFGHRLLSNTGGTGRCLWVQP